MANVNNLINNNFHVVDFENVDTDDCAIMASGEPSADVSALINEDGDYFALTASGAKMYAPLRSADEAEPVYGKGKPRCVCCGKELHLDDKVFRCEIDSSSSGDCKLRLMCEGCYTSHVSPDNLTDTQLNKIKSAANDLCYRLTLKTEYENEHLLFWALSRKANPKTWKRASKEWLKANRPWFHVAENTYTSSLYGHCRFHTTLGAIVKRCPRGTLVVEVIDCENPENCKSEAYSWQCGEASWKNCKTAIGNCAAEVLEKRRLASKENVAA